MITLNKKEAPFITLGRLRTAIREGTRERQIELYNKVSDDMSEMDIKIMHLEREVRELKGQQ